MFELISNIKKVKALLITSDLCTAFYSFIAGLSAYAQNELDFLNSLIKDTTSPLYKMGIWISLIYLIIRIIFYTIGKYYELKKKDIEIKRLQKELKEKEEEHGKEKRIWQRKKRNLE